MPDSVYSLTSLGALGAALYSFDRILNGRNQFNTAYIGWADCGGAVDGTCFTEWDVGAFLSGEYKGQATNPTLRFSGDADKAIYNKYRLNWLTPARAFPIPEPTQHTEKQPLPYATYQDFLNETKNLFNWVSKKDLPSYLSDEKIKSRGAKNKYLFGQNGVAWVSADKAGKVYAWKGNNSIVYKDQSGVVYSGPYRQNDDRLEYQSQRDFINGREEWSPIPSDARQVLDIDQAVKGKYDGNQLNFWNDATRLNPAGGVGISELNLRMESDRIARLLDAKLVADARQVIPPSSSLNGVTSITFPFIPTTRDSLSVTIAYEESNSSQTKLASSITREKETQDKHTVSIGAGIVPEKKEGGFAADIKYSYENLSRQKTASTSSSETTLTKTTGNKLTIAFNPSAVASTKIEGKQPDGTPFSFELVPGRYYKAYVTVNQSSLSSSLGGFARYSGSFGRLPLQSSFFGTSDDNVRSHDDQSPSLQNASVGDYIDIAIRKGRVNEVFGLPRVKKMVGDTILEVDQIELDDQKNLVTNLLWNSVDNVETDLTFKLDTLTSPSSALARFDELLPLSAKPNALQADQVDSSLHQYLTSAYEYFLLITNQTDKKPKHPPGSRSESSLKATQSHLSEDVNSISQKLFVRPLDDQASANSLLAPGIQDASIVNRLGQSLELDPINNSAIGLLQRDLNISGSDQSDEIMISGGNTADGATGEDYLIHYAEPGNPLTAYLSGGNGNDRIFSTGSTTVGSGGEDNDHAFAKGRFSFYGDSGSDTMHIADLEGEKFFADFDLFEDDVIIANNNIRDKSKIDAFFDFDHFTFNVAYAGKQVLSIFLGHDASSFLGVDSNRNLAKDDAFAYIISEARDKPLSQQAANQLLSAYFSAQSTGSDLFLQGFSSYFSDEHDGLSVGTFNNSPSKNVRSRNLTTKSNLISIIQQSPVIESAVTPFLKLISPQARKLSDLGEDDLRRIYETYQDVVSLHEQNMIYSSSGSADGVLTLEVGSVDLSSPADETREWSAYSSIAVSLVARLFMDKFVKPSNVSSRIDPLTGNFFHSRALSSTSKDGLLTDKYISNDGSLLKSLPTSHKPGASLTRYWYEELGLQPLGLTTAEHSMPSALHNFGETMFHNSSNIAII